MKKIKLNSVPYLRGDIISAYVDETTLEFRNGIACVEACITADGYRDGQYTYKCKGIIDENFCEVYDDSLEGDHIYQRNLMFIRYNKNITRLGDSDFVVEVSYGNEYATRYENRHIRIVDGIPILIGKVGDIQKTSNENLIISGNRLYDISLGKYITPEFYNIRESETYENVFDVVVKVIPGDKKDDFLGYVDYLFFRIDSNGNRVSKVASSFERKFIETNGRSIEKIIEARSAIMKFWFKSFTKRYVDALEKSEQFSEEFQISLKRKLKKEDVGDN